MNELFWQAVLAFLVLPGTVAFAVPLLPLTSGAPGPSFDALGLILLITGVVVFVNYNERRGYHVKIHHGLDSSKQDIFTEHFHVHGRLIMLGDRVERGQAMGVNGVGNRERVELPHYHFIVIKEESPGRFVALPPADYWFGIDQYKEKQVRGLGIGPFEVTCFNPSVHYTKEPIRFTYPVKCK